MREGSDGLTRLQRAVGLLCTDLEDDLVIDSTLSEIHDREGAEDIIICELHVDNRRIPRQSNLVTQESLFGSNPYLEPSYRRKVGRPPSVRNKNIRRIPDCANRSCSRWFECQGGFRKNLCAWDTRNNLGYFNHNEIRKRHRHFDKLMVKEPTLSKDRAALRVKIVY